MAGPGGREVGRVAVRVLPSTEQFARSLQRYLQRIERTTRLDIGLGIDQGDLRQTEARLAELTRDRKAEIKIDIDESVFDRIRTALAGMGGSGGSGGGFGGSGGVFGSHHSRRIALIATAITAITPAVLGLTGALLQASGALALIPALGLAGAAGIGVLALAFTGLEDAPASFQRLKAAVTGLGPEFDRLRQSVQGAFFADLAGPVRDLAEQYLPVLRERLTGVASAMNAVSLGLAGFLAQQRSLDDTGTGLVNTEVAIRNMVPGIVAFAAAFRDVAAVGSTFLPGLATGLSDIGTRFAAFIAQARDSGALAQFFTDSFAAVESLARSIGNLGSAFGGLIKAQGDTAGFLANLELVTAAIDQVINSAQGQAGFGALFSGISDGFAALFGNLGTMESLVGSIGPVLGELFRQFGTVGGALLDALAPALEVLSPLIVDLLGLLGAGLVAALQAVTPALTTVATFISDNIAPILAGLGTILIGLPIASFVASIAAAGGVLAALGGPLTLAVVAIAALAAGLVYAYQNSEAFRNVVAQVAEFVTGTLVPAFLGFVAAVREELMPIITQLAVFFMSTILPALQQVGAFVMSTLVPALISIGQAIASAVIPIAQALWQQFKSNLLPALQELWAVIATQVIPVLIQIGQRVAPLIAALASFAGMIAGTVVPVVINLVGPVLGALIRVIGTVLGWVAQLVGGFIRFGDSVGTVIPRMREFSESVRARIGEAVDTLRGLPGKAKDALGNLGSTLVAAGRQLIEGLLDGIRDKLAGLRAVMSTVASTVAGFLPGSPVKTGPLRSWNNGAAGARLVDMLATGLGDTRAVDRAMASLTSRIAAPNLTADLGFNGGAAGASAGGGATMNVYPRQGQSEYEIASIASRQLAFGMRT